MPKGRGPHHPRTRGTRRPAASREGHSRHSAGHIGQPAAHRVAVSRRKDQGQHQNETDQASDVRPSQLPPPPPPHPAQPIYPGERSTAREILAEPITVQTPGVHAVKGPTLDNSASPAVSCSTVEKGCADLHQCFIHKGQWDRKGVAPWWCLNSVNFRTISLFLSSACSQLALHLRKVAVRLRRVRLNSVADTGTCACPTQTSADGISPQELLPGAYPEGPSWIPF